MAAIWSGVFSIIIFLLRRNNDFIRLFGVIPLVLMISISAFRMIFAIELPFTTVINSGTVYTVINTVFYHTSENITSLNFISVFKFLWPAVTIGIIGVNTIRYNVSMKKAVALENEITPHMKALADKVIKDRYDKDVQVIVSSDIDVPFCSGYFKKYIFLPNLNYTDDELLCILVHEVSHIANNDLWIKALISFVTAVFWWNPFIWLLYYDLEQTLEIKCDITATSKMNVEQKTGYLETIIKVLKSFENKEKSFNMPMASFEFAKESNHKKMRQRFEIIKDYKRNPRREKLLLSVVSIVLVLLIAVSYMFILQPYYDMSDETIQEEYGAGQADFSDRYIYQSGDMYFLINNLEGTETEIDRSLADDLIAKGIPLF